MIIPLLRVVTSQFPIAATTAIEAGQVVALDSSGYAVKCGSAVYPIGLAADRNRAAEAYEWVSRISDFGQETRASGMLSVYHGGGEFWVNVTDTNTTTPNGTTIDGCILANATFSPNSALVVSSTDGVMSNTGGSNVVARVLEVASANVGVALDNGIPGEYEPNSVGHTNDAIPTKWVKIKLEI